MKCLTRRALAALALLILTVPMAAQAQERGGCWRNRDIAWDRHHLRGQWRDIRRDRFALRQDLANGNWAAARAEREDIQRDFMNVRRQRRDLYRDYQGFPGPGPDIGYMPPPPNYGATYGGYLPGSSMAYAPLTSYGNSAVPYYPTAPPNYPSFPAQNPGLLGLLSGGNSPMVPGGYNGIGAAPYYPNVPPNYAGVPAQNPGGLLGLLAGGNSAMVPGPYSGNTAAPYYPNGPSTGLGALLGNLIP